MNIMTERTTDALYMKYNVGKVMYIYSVEYGILRIFNQNISNFKMNFKCATLVAHTKCVVDTAESVLFRLW